MASLREWGFQITKSEVEGVLAGGLCNGFGDVSRRFSVAEDDQVRGPFLCHGFSIPFAYDQKLEVAEMQEETTQAENVILQ